MHDKSVRRHSAGRTRWAHPPPPQHNTQAVAEATCTDEFLPAGPLASSCASPQLPRHDVFPFPSPAVLNVIRFFPRRANFRRCPTTPPPRNSRAEASCVPAAAPLAPGASFPFERCPLSHSRCNVRVAHKETCQDQRRPRTHTASCFGRPQATICGTFMAPAMSGSLPGSLPDKHDRGRPPSAHPPDAGQRGRRWTQTQLPPPATPGVIFLSPAQVVPQAFCIHGCLQQSCIRALMWNLVFLHKYPKIYTLLSEEFMTTPAKPNLSTNFLV
nr:uncharacterized protein LOC113822136 [Penaeus vannamei]